MLEVLACLLYESHSFVFAVSFIFQFFPTVAARKYFEEKARLNFDPVTGERLIRSASKESTPSSSPALNPSTEPASAPVSEPLTGAVHDEARDAGTPEQY